MTTPTANEAESPLWLTTRQVASLLQVSERTLYEIAKRGGLARVTLPGGRGIRYRRSCVERFARKYGTAV